jgi:hypothetical protein
VSEYAGRHVVATVKYGKGYEAPWMVFHGSVSEVREDIATFFGIGSEVVTELTGNELLLNASQFAQGIGNAAALGAVAIPKQDYRPGASAPQGGNPWAGLEDEPSLSNSAIAHRKDVADSYLSTEHPFQHVLDGFAAATDVKELQKVWAANQSAFKDETVVAAYKARGKELS